MHAVNILAGALRRRKLRNNGDTAPFSSKAMYITTFSIKNKPIQKKRIIAQKLEFCAFNTIIFATKQKTKVFFKLFFRNTGLSCFSLGEGI